MLSAAVVLVAPDEGSLGCNGFFRVSITVKLVLVLVLVFVLVVL